MSAPYRYTQGVILNKDKIYLSAVAGTLKGHDPHKALIFETFDGQWSNWPVNYTLAGIACYELEGEPHLITAGASGVIETTAGEEVQIDGHATLNRPPHADRPLHTVRVFADKAFVAGASRQVYQRPLAEDTWIKVDERCQLPIEIERAGGFYDIDGSDSFVLAAGRHGAMWIGSNSKGQGAWARIDHNLTTANLHAVKCIGKQEFIAAGEQGTIIFADLFDTYRLHQNVTRETFTGIASAFGAIYLCTDQGNLFRITQGALEAVEPPFSSPLGGGSLDYADGLLLFVTHQHVALFDGQQWAIITPA